MTRVFCRVSIVWLQVGLLRLQENHLICFTRFTPSPGSRCRRRRGSRQWTPLWASPDGPVHASRRASMFGQRADAFLRIHKYSMPVSCVMCHGRLLRARNVFLQCCPSVWACCEVLRLLRLEVCVLATVYVCSQGMLPVRLALFSCTCEAQSRLSFFLVQSSFCPWSSIGRVLVVAQQANPLHNGGVFTELPSVSFMPCLVTGSALVEILYFLVYTL